MTITVSFCFSPSKLVKLSSCLSVIVACLDPGVVLVSGRERNTVSFPYSLQQKVKQKKKNMLHITDAGVLFGMACKRAVRPLRFPVAPYES